MLSTATIPAAYPRLSRRARGFRGCLPAACIPTACSSFGFLHLAGTMLFLLDFLRDIRWRIPFGHFAVYHLFYLVLSRSARDCFTVTFQSRLDHFGPRCKRSDYRGHGRVTWCSIPERILTLVFIFVVPIPAVFILGYCFCFSFLQGLTRWELAQRGAVAVWAHVGGFLLGVLLTQLCAAR